MGFTNLVTYSDVPAWAKGSIFYQIFIDRFHKSPSHRKNLVPGRNYRDWGEEVELHRNIHGYFHNNDFFCGDIEGITEKIPYLKKLGVQVIYLSPITYSNYRYDRYAATNHMLIDPDAGSYLDLRRLHSAASKNNIHIILDIALNHCCTNNPIYKDAFTNENSEFKDWFKRDSHGNISYWYGFDDMPEFNQFNEGYQNFVYGDGGVIEKLSKYCDGFRLDLAECLEPFVIEGIKRKANEKFPHLIVGEYWKNADKSVIGYGLDSVTCYPLSNAILKFLAFGECDYLESQMKELCNVYPQSNLDALLVSLDTHDIPRAITMLGKSDCMRRGYTDIWNIDSYPSKWHTNGMFNTDEFRRFEHDNDILSKEEYNRGVNLLKIGTVLQYFYLGSPCIYYGTEAGLTGFKDPFNRKCYPWGHEDKKLLSFYMSIGQFRHNFNSIKANPNVLFKDSDLFIFERKNNKNSVFVAVNRSNNNERKIQIPKEYEGCKSFCFNTKGLCSLLPYGAIVVLKQN